MRACAFKVGGFALGSLMDVECMIACWQVEQVGSDLYAGARLLKHGGTNALTFGILQVNFYFRGFLLGRCWQRTQSQRQSRKQGGEDDSFGFHELHYSDSRLKMYHCEEAQNKNE